MSASSPALSPAPSGSLLRLASILREEDTVISACVVEPGGEPLLGQLCAYGPRAEAAPGEYSLVVECVREGYLLHYGASRILAGHDMDLALLAGDYLYAQGIDRLAALGDITAIHELSDLISLAAEAQAEGRDDLAGPLWLAATVAVGCGPTPEHEAAKASARALEMAAGAALLASARAAAEAVGLGDPFGRAADSIDFASRKLWTSELRG